MYGPLESSVDKSFSTLASDNLDQTTRTKKPTYLNLENIEFDSKILENGEDKKIRSKNYETATELTVINVIYVRPFEKRKKKGSISEEVESF